jgi:hypothetical protein
MMSALAVDAVIVAAVLQADLGSRRRAGLLRLLRPLLIAAAIVPLFLMPVVAHGNGLTVELILAAAGVGFGLVATWLLPVSGDSLGRQAFTSAGRAYALLWTAVIGARAVFSYGADHWFTHSLGVWQLHHAVTTAAITDALIVSERVGYRPRRARSHSRTGALSGLRAVSLKYLPLANVIADTTTKMSNASNQPASKPSATYKARRPNNHGRDLRASNTVVQRTRLRPTSGLDQRPGVGVRFLLVGAAKTSLLCDDRRVRVLERWLLFRRRWNAVSASCRSRTDWVRSLQGRDLGTPSR